VLLVAVLAVLGVVVVRMASGTPARPAPAPAGALAPSASTAPAADPPGPDASPTGTAPATRTPSPGARPIEARYQVTSVWDTGLVARVRVTNNAGTAQSWVVSLTLPAGVEPTSVWNAQLRRTGQAFRFSADPLRAGASVTFGFQANRTGAYQPVSCTVNGVPC
jgi:cellulase/cellobiase CelA1